MIQRAVALGHGIEVADVLAQLLEPLRDQLVVLHLVVALAGEHALGVDLRRRGHPQGGDLAGFHLASQGQLEQVHHLDVAVGLGLQRLMLTELGEQLLHLLGELRHELLPTEVAARIAGRLIGRWVAHGILLPG